MKYFKTFESMNGIHQEILANFNAQKTFPYSGELYHGTSINGVISILKEGIGTYHHQELNDYFFCVSHNPNMVNLLGRNGFCFQADFKKVLDLSRFYYDLLACETGIEKWWQVDEEQFEAWKQQAERWNLKAWGDYGINSPSSFWETYFFANPKFKDCEGVAIPGSFDYHTPNSEAEIAVTQSGIQHLKISEIMIEGKWYDPSDINVDELIEKYGYNPNENED